jgi:hypothetical protein
MKKVHVSDIGDQPELFRLTGRRVQPLCILDRGVKIDSSTNDKNRASEQGNVIDRSQVRWGDPQSWAQLEEQ